MKNLSIAVLITAMVVILSIRFGTFSFVNNVSLGILISITLVNSILNKKIDIPLRVVGGGISFIWAILFFVSSYKEEAKGSTFLLIILYVVAVSLMLTIMSVSEEPETE